jgi:hypothetical protein
MQKDTMVRMPIARLMIALRFVGRVGFVSFMLIIQKDPKGC